MPQPNLSRSTIQSLEEQGAQARQAAHYSYAQSRYTQALALREQQDGPTNLGVASILTLLGKLAQTLAQFDEAETFYQRALTICEETLGHDDPETIRCLGDMAGIYHAQGRYEQAEPLYREFIALSQWAYGEQIEMGKARSAFACFLRERGDHLAALPLFTQAIALYEETLDTDPFDLATTLNDLAVLYLDQHRPSQAAPLLDRALAIFQKQGSIHPSIAVALKNLGTVSFQRREYHHAEEQYQQALCMQEHLFGPQHPRIASTLAAMADLYNEQQRWSQASACLHRAQTILINTLGPTHPETQAMQATAQAVQDRSQEEKHE